MIRRACLRLLLFIASVALGLAGAISTEAVPNGAADGTDMVTVNYASPAHASVAVVIPLTPACRHQPTRIGASRSHSSAPPTAQPTCRVAWPSQQLYA